MSDRNSWNWNYDYSAAWHATSDPRIVAVIERDDNAELPDDEGQAPALIVSGYGSRADFTECGSSVDGGVREAWITARAHNGEAFADRFVKVFCGATVHHASSSIDQYGWAVAFDVPEWREAMGIAPRVVLDRDNVVGELKAYLDGEAFGVGYAVIPGRVTVETGFDIESADLTIECWGFYGEEYAMRAALDFECGSPDLETLIDWSNN